MLVLLHILLVFTGFLWGYFAHEKKLKLQDYKEQKKLKLQEHYDKYIEVKPGTTIEIQRLHERSDQLFLYLNAKTEEKKIDVKAMAKAMDKIDDKLGRKRWK